MEQRQYRIARKLEQSEFLKVLEYHSFTDSCSRYWVVYMPGGIPVALFRMRIHAESFCDSLGSFGEVKEFEVK